MKLPRTWEIDTWEVALGKMPLGKYLTPLCTFGCDVLETGFNSPSQSQILPWTYREQDALSFFSLNQGV